MNNHYKTEKQMEQTRPRRHSLTRRGFFQAGAAASASLLIGSAAAAEADAAEGKISFDSYDVAVIGAGPGGLAAAITAARNGARVILIERNGYLGGNLASGLPLLGYLDCHGKAVVGGFATEFIDRLTKIGAALGVRRCPHHYSIAVVKPDFCKIVASDLCEETGVEVLLHCYLTAVETQKGKITKALFSCAGNTIEVRARIFIDGTGDGTLGYLAGAACQKGNEEGELQPPSILYTLGGVDKEKFFSWCKENDEVGDDTLEYLHESPNWGLVTLGKLFRKLQPKGEWPIAVWALISINRLNDSEICINGPRMLRTDATDPRDLTRAEREGAHQAVAFTEMLKKYVGGFEQAYISHMNDTIGIRETRRIVGRKMLRVEEAIAASVPEDTIALAAYFIDIHSSKDFTSKGERIEQAYGIPYLCLVSATYDNLMMVGRCISVDRIVFGSTRVMATCLAGGEAAGVGAALAIKEQCSPGDVDTVAVRRILVKNGGILSMNQTP